LKGNLEKKEGFRNRSFSRRRLGVAKKGERAGGKVEGAEGKGGEQPGQGEDLREGNRK